LERAIGTKAAARAIAQRLVGHDGSDRLRPYLVPLYDLDGAVVSATRIDVGGVQPPVRLWGLARGVPCWAVNFAGGPRAALDAAKGSDLHLTLSAAVTLGKAESEPCIGLTGKASFNELVGLLAAWEPWRLPERAVCWFGGDVYPAQLQRLRQLGIKLFRQQTREERDEVRRTAAKSAPMFQMANGRIAYWSVGRSGGQWREAAKGVGPNLLVERGASVGEAKAMLPLLRTAVDYRFETRSTEPVLEDGHEVFLNTYTGLPVTGRSVPWGTIWTLIDHLCGSDVDGVEYLLDWLASPLQALYSGEGSRRNMSAVIFHGDQGTGKGWLAEVLRAVYGQYMIEIGQAQLEDTFEHKRFMSSLLVVANEVSCNSRRGKQMLGRLKSWVTESRISIRRMRLEAEEHAIHFNLMFFSNMNDPVPLEDSDRRFSVYHQTQKVDRDMVRALREEKARGWPSVAGFVRALLDREITRDLWHPFENDARRQLKDLTRDSALTFAEVLMSDGVHGLGSDWARDEHAKNARAGINASVHLTGADGFVLLSTLSAIYAMWAKKHGHRETCTAGHLRRALQRRLPWARYRRGSVATRYGWGFDGIPATSRDKLTMVGDGAPVDGEANLIPFAGTSARLDDEDGDGFGFGDT